MSERQKKIVENIGVRPDDRVLEIGCGQGVAATYICEQLDGGRYVGLDRSPKMIRAAARRNEKHVESGKAEFIVSEMEDANLGVWRFDKILAVRVGMFHREPDLAREIVEKWLAPGGEVFVAFDPMNINR